MPTLRSSPMSLQLHNSWSQLHRNQPTQSGKGNNGKSWQTILFYAAVKDSNIQHPARADLPPVLPRHEACKWHNTANDCGVRWIIWRKSSSAQSCCKNEPLGLGEPFCCSVLVKFLRVRGTTTGKWWSSRSIGGCGLRETGRSWDTLTECLLKSQMPNSNLSGTGRVPV